MSLYSAINRILKDMSHVRKDGKVVFDANVTAQCDAAAMKKYTAAIKRTNFPGLVAWDILDEVYLHELCRYEEEIVDRVLDDKEVQAMHMEPEEVRSIVMDRLSINIDMQPVRKALCSVIQAFCAKGDELRVFDRFAVRIVRKGGKYGLNDCLTHDKEEPLVEFYDVRYADEIMPRGQFVSRYCLSTFLNHKRGTGLELDGGIEAWRVTPETMDEIIEWIHEQEARREVCHD